MLIIKLLFRIIFVPACRKTIISAPVVLFFLDDDRLAAASLLIERYGTAEDKANLALFFEQGIKAFDSNSSGYSGPMF